MTGLPVPGEPALRERLIEGMSCRAAALTGHGMRLFIGTLADYPDGPARILAALGEAEAGQELEPTHVIWRKAGGGEWVQGISCSEAELSALADRASVADAADGVTAQYLVLPLGEEPGQAGDGS